MGADFLQGLRLDLANALAGNPELLTHLFKCVINTVGETVPHLEDLALFWREVIQDPAHLLSEDALG